MQRVGKFTRLPRKLLKKIAAAADVSLLNLYLTSRELYNITKAQFCTGWGIVSFIIIVGDIFFF